MPTPQAHPAAKVEVRSIISVLSLRALMCPKVQGIEHGLNGMIQSDSWLRAA